MSQSETKYKDNDKVKNNTICKKDTRIKFFKINPSLSKFIDNQHFYNLSNILYINERALKDSQNYDGSFTQTIFSFKRIKKVEIIHQTLILWLTGMKEQSSFEYLSQRLNSYGDLQMHKMALQLQKLKIGIDQVCNINKLDQNYQKKQYQKLINFIKENDKKQYFLYYTPFNKIGMKLKALVMPFKLLKTLGCEPQKLTIQYLRLNSMTDQFINPRIYFDIMKNYVEQLNILLQKKLRQKNNQQNSEDSFKRIITDLYTRNNQKLTVQARWIQPDPILAYLEIYRILGKTSCYQIGKQKIQRLKLKDQQISIKQLQTLQLIDQNLIKSKKRKGLIVAQYRQIQRQ